MADPFSLATGVISLVVVTLQVIAGVSRMLDKTVTAHRAANEELERLRVNLEDLQRRMESNHEKLQLMASNTKDRGFKKLLQSEAGQAAVARLCQVLEKTQCSLKRLADQTESEGATLLVNALPLKKRSLAFVCAVLKYNVSPETIDEMTNNLREMQTEVQDCLRHLETSLNDVGDLHDFFHRQLRLMRVSISSHISTSTTLTARLQLVRWLENFGGQPGYSGRSGHERKAAEASQDEDEPHTEPLPQALDSTLAEMERLLCAETNPPPLPRPTPLNGMRPPAHVEATQRCISPQNSDSDTDSGGSNVGIYRVPWPRKGQQTSVNKNGIIPPARVKATQPLRVAPPPRPTPLNGVRPPAHVEATQRCISPQSSDSDTDSGGSNVGIYHVPWPRKGQQTVNKNGIKPPARVKATQRWISLQPQNTYSDGSIVSHDFVPLEYKQTGPDARKPSTSSNWLPPMRLPHTATKSQDSAKHRQPVAVKPRGYHTQAETELARIFLPPSRPPSSTPPRVPPSWPRAAAPAAHSQTPTLPRPSTLPSTPPAVPRWSTIPLPSELPRVPLQTKPKAPLQVRPQDRWLPIIEDADTENDDPLETHLHELWLHIFDDDPLQHERGHPVIDDSDIENETLLQTHPHKAPLRSDELGLPGLQHRNDSPLTGLII